LSIDFEKKARGESSAYLYPIRKQLALVYAHVGDFSKAERQWEQAFSKFSPNEEVRFSTPIKANEVWPNAGMIETLFIKAKIYQLSAEKEPKYSALAFNTYQSIGVLIDRIVERLNQF
jgi:tetratricopeptide (TPR) repeat protein